MRVEVGESDTELLRLCPGEVRSGGSAAVVGDELPRRS